LALALLLLAAMTTNVEAIKITGLQRNPLLGRVSRLMTAALKKLVVAPVKGEASFFDDNGPKGGPTMRCALTVRVPFREGLRGPGASRRGRASTEAVPARIGEGEKTCSSRMLCRRTR